MDASTSHLNDDDLPEFYAPMDSGVENALDADAESEHTLADPIPANRGALEPGDGLYGPTLRSTPLLSREEEEDLGQIIQESRVQMTELLAEVPAAVATIIDMISQAHARKRPITDALFAPFGRFSGLSQTEAFDETMNWRHVAQLGDQLLGDWRLVNGAAADPYEREKVCARLKSFARSVQPGWVALREGLRTCEALDGRVAELEDERGTFYADTLDPDSRKAVHGRLLRIGGEAGVELTVLREIRRAAASAYARYTSARDRMVNANIGLTYSISHRLQGNNLSFDDLVQEAIIGLMRAVDKYDYRMGFKFSTYAVQWIRQATTRAIADSSRTIRVATHVHDEVVRLRRLTRELEQSLGRDPSDADLAKVSSTPESKIQQYLRASRHPVSFITPLTESQDSSRSWFIADAGLEDPYASTHDARLTASVASILGELPERDAFILRLRHGIGGTESHTLEEIGRMLGITRERTRQLEARAVKQLRETLRPEILRDLDD
jgi:RNA polymerase primary sigma factor